VSAPRIERTLTYAVLAVFAIGAIYPVISILFLALHTKSDLVTGFAWPTDPKLDSFRAAWDQGSFATGFKSSFIVAFAVTVVSAVLALGTGYAFGTMRFRGDRPLFALFLLGIIFPYEATVIPLYYDFKDFGLLNTYWSLILPQIGQSVAFGTFWMRAFFRSVPRSLVEAARLDGSSSWSTLWRVVLPLGRPAVLTMMVLVFTWTWNEFLLALVMVSDEGLRTAPLGLAFFSGRNTTDFALLAAGSVIVATPVVVLYVFLQRHFIRGMLSGAVKG
jgi:raffinose/stachyose/melibiose transport system permease protein